MPPDSPLLLSGARPPPVVDHHVFPPVNHPPPATRFARLLFAFATAACAFSATAIAGERLRAELDAFTGEWVGELRVHALDGFLLKTFPARRSYAWQDDSQVVVTRFFDGASDHEIRSTRRLERGLWRATVIRPGQPQEDYAGRIEAGAVVWTNSAGNSRDATEQLVTTRGVTRLETTSSEIMRVLGISGVVRVEGTFERPVPGAKPAIDQPAEAAADDQSVGLERELAAAREAAEAAMELRAENEALERESEAMRTRLREVERERTVLAERLAEAGRVEARVRGLEAELTAAREAAREASEVVAARTREAAALRERLASLETELAALQSAQAAAFAANTGADALRQQLAARESELADLQKRLGQERAAAAREREQHAAAVVELEQRLAQQDAALAAAHGEQGQVATAQAELQTARREIETLKRELAESVAASGRVAARNRELEAALAQVAEDRAGWAAEMDRVARENDGLHAEVERLRAGLATAETELTAAREEAGALAAGQERLETELAEAHRALRAKDQALRAAEEASAGRERATAAAELRIQELEAQLTAVDELRAALAAERERTAAQQQENQRLAARLAELAREPDPPVVATAGDMPEPELLADEPLFSLSRTRPAAPAASIRDQQREEVLAEMERLQRRVTELESERNLLRTQHEVLTQQIQQAQQLRDDTLARFQDVVAQLNAMREERDRLARANVSLQAELRAARGPNATSTAVAASERTAPSFLDRLLGVTDEPASPAKTGTSAGARRAPPAATEREIQERLERMQVIGITHTPEEDKVILDGRLYRSNDIIDAKLGLVFIRIDGNALVFADEQGREYRRRF